LRLDIRWDNIKLLPLCEGENIRSQYIGKKKVLKRIGFVTLLRYIAKAECSLQWSGKRLRVRSRFAILCCFWRKWHHHSCDTRANLIVTRGFRLPINTGDLNAMGTSSTHLRLGDMTSLIVQQCFFRCFDFLRLKVSFSSIRTEIQLERRWTLSIVQFAANCQFFWHLSIGIQRLIIDFI